VLSGLIGLAFPDIAFGTDTAGRYFQGLMMHRNDLGRLAMIGVCSLLALALLNRFSWPLWRVALLVILVGLLLLTRSITSLLTTLMLIVTYLAVVDRVLLLRFAIALMTVLVVAVAIASPELLVSAVGKDATLTGRTQLWVWAWERIKEAPYLGHGYYALFNHLGLETGWYDLFPGMGFDTGLAHPHNGFLMIALDGGWPLLAIVIAMLVVQLRNSAALLHFGHPYGGVGLLFVVMQTVYNVTEVSFFRLNDLMWTLSLIVYIKVAAVHGQLIAGSSARLPLSSPSTGAMLVPAERMR
jgi:O-antigen ligase